MAHCMIASKPSTKRSMSEHGGQTTGAMVNSPVTRRAPVPTTKESRTTALWLFVKWNLMASALFWLLAYRLSETAEKLPEFVYVNF